MDQRDDMTYLKIYVKSHPDNRMAWYLLGKQYMLEEKEAKANYCFLQAGNIYEAYERKQHPLANKEPQQIIHAWNRKRKFKLLAARTITVAILLFFMVLADPFSSIEKERNDQSLQPAVSIKSEQGREQLQVVFVKSASKQAIGQALATLLAGSDNANAGLAVMLEQKDKWRKWTGNTRLLLSAKRQGSGGQAYDIQLLDAQVCNCQPSDVKEAKRSYMNWSEIQEERWTLQSAITQYQALYHEWPKTIDDMIRPYPNNVLSGEADHMRAMFPDLVEKLKISDRQRSLANVSGSPNQDKSVVDSNGRSAAASQSQAAVLPEQPLSIIVDKQTHRLAVVSGDIIVRSYSVGLGGEKTPSGSFTISEKVKNPNGRDNGEFGSRGMTLSGTRYAIHGTDEPSSIGKDESHGCVRMKKEDIEELFDLVPLGTRVEIKNGVLPDGLSPAKKRFKLHPMQDETNPVAVYRWL